MKIGIKTGIGIKAWRDVAKTQRISQPARWLGDSYL